MKIAVIGAGGIGGLVAARFALAGEDVTCMVRGANLEAIRRGGIRLLEQDGRESVARKVKATNDYAEAGPQDVVVIATKAHQVDGVAPLVPALLGEGTVVVPMQNGIPWWYFDGHGGEWDGHRVASVDPAGTIGTHIPSTRVIGCVVYPAAELIAPGVIRHVEGDRFPLGELNGATTGRVTALSDAFTRAGFKAPVLPDIRAEIWLKLWGNLTFNPISALTRATLVDICQYPPTRDLAIAMMIEAQTIANKLGVTFRVSIERRVAGAEKVGKHKTSMLQDVEAGRESEVDALLGSVVELGRLTQTPTPTIDAAYALMKLLGKSVVESAAPPGRA